MKWWLFQNFRALSRLTNSLLGGEGDTTLSAYSWELAHNRKGFKRKFGLIRVMIIDTVFLFLLKKKNHCYDSWVWHQERNLFQRDGVI